MIEILNIIALIFIPIFAVIVGQRLQTKHQKRNDKMQIFKILMTHRIFGWTNESVQALNLIDIKINDMIRNKNDIDIGLLELQKDIHKYLNE